MSLAWWPSISVIWEQVSPHADARTLSDALSSHPDHTRNLWAATWFDCEFNNGGLYQFLWNIPTVCPHAIRALEAIGFPRAAEALREAEALTGGPFSDRDDACDKQCGFDFDEPRLRVLEERIMSDVFDVQINQDRFGPAMVRYAARHRAD